MNRSVEPFAVVIPARYASNRLPGKPLRMLAGEPLILHVVRRAQAAGADGVVVATDDARIEKLLQAHSVEVMRTRPDHVSGSDRLAECVARLGWGDEQIVVNLQGDEPFAPPSGIVRVTEILAQSDAPMATLATPIEDIGQLYDRNVVKLVRNRHGRALYFSRAPIPWSRDAFADDPMRLPNPTPFLRHIGIYAYRVGFLIKFSRLPKTPLEQAESLEQLRVLEHGYSIVVDLAPESFPAGIDTVEDLQRAEALLSSLG